MKKQRSRVELLLTMKAYESVKKDRAMGTEYRQKTVYWRMGVEWSVVLWKEEKFSANEIAKLLQYVAEHNVTELTEERREEIRQMLSGKVDWTLKNMVVKRNKDNVVDREIDELVYHNTKISVDYSLLACEYLITHKGYGKKRLDRVIGNVRLVDYLDASDILRLRQELFDVKGIWIDLEGDKPPENSRII